jgi:hypothetical protein
MNTTNIHRGHAVHTLDIVISWVNSLNKKYYNEIEHWYEKDETSGMYLIACRYNKTLYENKKEIIIRI